LQVSFTLENGDCELDQNHHKKAANWYDHFCFEPWSFLVHLLFPLELRLKNEEQLKEILSLKEEKSSLSCQLSFLKKQTI